MECTECGKPAVARKLCPKHYYHERKRTGPLPSKTPEQRFWEKVTKQGPIPVYRPELGPCWLWKGALSSGYGSFSLDGRTQYAHRIAYGWLVGQIPDGLQLDHLCRNPPCCNPTHLEPVTSGENSVRGLGPKLTSQRQRGVPLTPEHIENMRTALRNANRDRTPQECGLCGRVFAGTQPLGVHLARTHEVHARRYPR